MTWFVTAWMRYADFYGRSRRMELWFFALFNFMAIIIFGAIDSLFIGAPALSALYCLVSFIPSFAATVRRLHDVGKRGTWLFIALIPVIGPIWLLTYLVCDSQHGINDFGPNPKGK